MKTLTLTLLVFFFFSFSAYADITQGLIGHWKFDEGNGRIAHDTSKTENPLSGNENHGMLVNGPEWDTDVAGDGTLNFYGTKGYVNLGDIEDFEYGPDDRFSIPR